LKPFGVIEAAALGREHVRGWLLLALQTAQSA
jgi:hypothetical protein